VQDDPSTTEQPHAVRMDDPGATPRPADTLGRGPVDEASANLRICPFLRSTDDGDRLGTPVEAPDQTNRCAALSGPVPQSLRQQELVCLTSGHVNCPRYMRGAMTVAKPLDRVPAARIVTPAIAGSVLAVIGAFLLSVAFVVANGGLTLTAAAPGGPTGAVLGEVETAAPTATTAATTPLATATAAPTTAPTPSPTPVASPTPTPSPTASPSPTPSPATTATPAPTPKPTAKPSSSRYALLKPCSGTPACYVYVIRSGDNLYSIANYFGVPLKTVKAWNPWTADGLKAGRGLRIPPPTR
jgi:LysM repeat protein